MPLIYITKFFSHFFVKINYQDNPKRIERYSSLKINKTKGGVLKVITRPFNIHID